MINQMRLIREILTLRTSPEFPTLMHIENRPFDKTGLSNLPWMQINVLSLPATKTFTNPYDHSWDKLINHGTSAPNLLNLASGSKFENRRGNRNKITIAESSVYQLQLEPIYRPAWQAFPWHHTARILAVSNNYVIVAKFAGLSALKRKTFTLCSSNSNIQDGSGPNRRRMCRNSAHRMERIRIYGVDRLVTFHNVDGNQTDREDVERHLMALNR